MQTSKRASHKFYTRIKPHQYVLVSAPIHKMNERSSLYLGPHTGGMESISMRGTIHYTIDNRKGGRDDSTSIYDKKDNADRD